MSKHHPATLSFSSTLWTCFGAKHHAIPGDTDPELFQVQNSAYPDLVGKTDMRSPNFGTCDSIKWVCTQSHGRWDQEAANMACAQGGLSWKKTCDPRLWVWREFAASRRGVKSSRQMSKRTKPFWEWMGLGSECSFGSDEGNSKRGV